MKTSIFVCILSFCSINISNAQIGVNVDNPKEMLDIKGSLQVRNEVKVGDESDPGKSGQILVSQGADLPPKWIDLPKVGKRLVETLTKMSNESGGGYIFGPILPWNSTDTNYKKVTFVDDGTVAGSNDAAAKPIELLENSPLTEPWQELPTLKNQIYIEKENSLVAINLQGMLQATSNNSSISVVSVGVFFDNQLKSVRTLSLLGMGRPFLQLSLNDILSDLPPKPTVNGQSVPYDIRVAVRLRYFYGYYAGASNNNTFPVNLIDSFVLFGQGIFALENKEYVINGTTQTPVIPEGQGNSNDFMNKLSFMVNLYEPNN